MVILTWFGRVDLQTGSLLTGAVLGREESEGISEPQQYPASAFPLPQPDLRLLAKACGFVADDEEYNRLLREAALGLVRRSILAGSTVEQDLLQALEALDDLSQAINLLDERLYEWSRLHSQEIVHGKDLAEGLKEDENMGLLAKAILGLREARKATETDVSATVQSLAPQSLLPGWPRPGGKAHLSGRRTLPSGKDAFQSSAGHGRREVSLQASSGPCTFSQARHHLSPSCCDRISQKTAGTCGSDPGGKAGHRRPPGPFRGGPLFGSAGIIGCSIERYKTERTK